MPFSSQKPIFYFWAYAAHGEGISGSDRIFIELARRWSRKSEINIFLWTEGYRMCQRNNLESPNIIFHISKMSLWYKMGFVINYFARIIAALQRSFTLKLQDGDKIIVYSASDFWMDSLPCWILKIRYPNIKWVASWFQTAPNPLKGFKEGDREKSYRLGAFLYWFMQMPMKPLIKRYADFVFVNNEEERKQFSKLDKKGKVVVLIGAVDIDKVRGYISKHKKEKKTYAAVFQGRFHPQKGVVELIDIWRKVVNKKPDAKLAMIGDGPLMEDVKQRIKSLKLGKNVELKGVLFDGEEKYRIFNGSKIVVHPAFYDSGGMAAAEAMIFGLPCVGFDLKAYESYYPKGMIKVPIGDYGEFADRILELLDKEQLRKKAGLEAASFIEINFSWDKRAAEIYQKVIN